MALDEALLETCAAAPERFTPVLRLYAFQPACLSLGRFQPLTDVDPEACARLSVDVVRRPTGGRAVLHDRCLTYALVAAVEAPPFAGGVRVSAARIGATLADGLRPLVPGVAPASAPERGRRPADCFAVAGAGELVVEGRKLVGSAQLRRGGAALQHGTLRLRPDAGRLAGLLRYEHSDDITSHGPTELDALCGRPVTFTEAAQAVAEGMARIFAVTLEGSTTTGEERARAEKLEQERYRCAAWTAAR